MMQLRPYQKEGAAFLAARRTALLADEMGLGKSAQAIHACFAADPAPDVCVVCPASVVANWYREFEAFWPAWPIAYTLTVMSYNMAAKVDWSKNGTFDVLILDEAHYLKSKDAKRTQAILGKEGLVHRATHVYALTGTPMPNHPAEMWALLRTLAPETIASPKTGKPYNYWQFVSRFCRTQDIGFGTKIIGGKNHENLREALRPFMLRRLKSEVAGDLPPLDFADLAVEGQLNESSTSSDEMRRIERCLEQHGVEGLAAIAGHVATLRRITGVAKAQPVAEWVKDWLDGCDRKIVLFAHHAEVIDKLIERLAPHVSLVWLTGGMSQAKRQESVDRFQTDPKCRVFIGQVQAAGTGITLTAASDALFVESSWVPAENSQAAMRIHRIGQSEPCLVRFAMLAGSIDEKVAGAVRRKTADIARVIGADDAADVEPEFI